MAPLYGQWKGSAQRQPPLEGQMEGLAPGTVSLVPTTGSQPSQDRSTQSTLPHCILPGSTASLTTDVRIFGAAQTATGAGEDALPGAAAKKEATGGVSTGNASSTSAGNRRSRHRAPRA